MERGKSEKLCVEQLMQAYKTRLRMNNVGLNTILYSCNYMYEYNPVTHEIRPFNSLVWYTLDSVKYTNILDYIEDKYDNANLGDPEDINCIIDNTMIVNLDNLKDEILDSDTISSDKVMSLVEELDSFGDKIKSVYNEWRRLALFVLNSYENIDNILDGRMII